MLTINRLDLLTTDDIRRENWRKDALEEELKLSQGYNIRKEDLLKRTYFQKLQFIDCGGQEN